jgi:choline dehydrogenase
VFDGQSKVHGFKNFREIDASVSRTFQIARIQNAVYMVGEEGADPIKAGHRDLY